MSKGCNLFLLSALRSQLKFTQWKFYVVIMKTNNKHQKLLSAHSCSWALRLTLSRAVKQKLKSDWKKKENDTRADSETHLLYNDLYLTAFLIIPVCLTRDKQALLGEILNVVNNTSPVLIHYSHIEIETFFSFELHPRDLRLYNWAGNINPIHPFCKDRFAKVTQRTFIFGISAHSVIKAHKGFFQREFSM